jgi:hypothetical protein
MKMLECFPKKNDRPLRYRFVSRVAAHLRHARSRYIKREAAARAGADALIALGPAGGSHSHLDAKR